MPFGAHIGFGNNAIQFTNYPWGGGLGPALTLGNVQIIPRPYLPNSMVPEYRNPSASVNLGLHEQAHTIQFEVFGPVFLPVYFLFGGPSANNPFEHAADESAAGRGGTLP